MLFSFFFVYEAKGYNRCARHHVRKEISEKPQLGR